MFQFPPRKCSMLDTLTVQPVKGKKKKKKGACWESGWSSDEHLLCPPFILFLSLTLLPPLGCYWSDLLLSQLEPWFMLFRLGLTHHTQTQLSHALPYLSVHLSLPALPLSGLRHEVNLLSTQGHHGRLAPACDYNQDCSHYFQSLLFSIFCNKILFFLLGSESTFKVVCRDVLAFYQLMHNENHGWIGKSIRQNCSWSIIFAWGSALLLIRLKGIYFPATESKRNHLRVCSSYNT